MHKSATKCNETVGKWCINKHGASKIIDTLETYHWQSNLLSYGDRLVLINSVLTSLPIFMLSFLEIPVGVRKRIDYFRSRFFWQSHETKNKYRLTKWGIIYRPKEQGGLGVEVLEIKNKCLLRKWLFKRLTEEGIWQ
jgi:hypothetical protein